MTIETETLAESGSTLRKFLSAFTAGAGTQLVTELRALESPQPWGVPRTEYGFFDLMTEAGRSAFEAAVMAFVRRDPGRQPAGVYVTINPMGPDLMARACNRLKVAAKKGDGETAMNKHAVRRRWLVIDADPERVSGVSATDHEKARAREVVEYVRHDMQTLGWPPAMLCDSGNGYHLWYPIDLPAEDGGRVERVIKGVAKLYGDEAVKIDTSVFNAGRIIKLPGTWARKGDSTPNRPHRLARVLEVPT